MDSSDNGNAENSTVEKAAGALSAEHGFILPAGYAYGDSAPESDGSAAFDGSAAVPTPGLQTSEPAATRTARARMSVRRMLMRRAVVASVIAIAALVVSYHYGGLLGGGRFQALHEGLALGGAVVFLVAAVLAVRSGTNDLIELTRVPGHLGDARTATFRLVCLLAGYIIVILCALALVHVSVTHLLLGGVLTGVILGIAAQQVLANLFAGIMLLFAHPFTVGDELTIRSGALGGPIIGRVTDMTLTYVTVLTKAGPVLLPNSAVLAAAVGPATEWVIS